MEGHDEDLIANHTSQLEKLNEATQIQNRRLKENNRAFEELTKKIKNVEEELLEKKIQNGNTRDEVKSLRDMIIETNQNVAYLRGLKDGSLEQKSDKKDTKMFLIQIIFIGIGLVNLGLFAIKEVFHWI